MLSKDLASKFRGYLMGLQAQALMTMGGEATLDEIFAKKTAPKKKENRLDAWEDFIANFRHSATKASTAQAATTPKENV